MVKIIDLPNQTQLALLADMVLRHWQSRDPRLSFRAFTNQTLNTPGSVPGRHFIQADIVVRAPDGHVVAAYEVKTPKASLDEKKLKLLSRLRQSSRHGRPDVVIGIVLPEQQEKDLEGIIRKLERDIGQVEVWTY